MNNHRLLSGLLCAVLMSGSVCADAKDSRVFTIEDLFEIAESNSVQLRPLFTAEDEARRKIDVARDGCLPEITADLSFSFIGDGFTTKRDFSDSQKAPIPHFGNGLSLTVEQPVYTGGAITAGIELAELKSTAARYATELQRDNIRFRLAGFYLDIYKYHNLRRVVENNLIQARKVLSDMEVRFSEGVALRNDITRYELLVSNLELQLIKIDNVLRLLNSNLVTTAGLPADTEIVPDSTILARVLPCDGEAWWQDEAALNAPALKLARSSVDISRKAETIVRSERLPKVGLRAGWTIDGPILVEVPPINRNLSYWYVGVGVSYNLSSLYKNEKSLSRSKIATIKAEEELDAAREDISLRVRADYIGYLEAYEVLKTRNKSVELADRNYNVTATRYAAGMALITDMLDAANSKLDAEQQLVNAHINIIYYYYKLLFTSGKI
ncbi:MAG: TolC family protein [Muribaculaceae bacterium]|nr:TolC family protein [Muribaculaceae bacterium]